MSRAKPSTPKPIGPVRYFQDQLYTSRTLVMPDGQTLRVTESRVAAFGDDQHDFLQAHPDFELQSE